MDPEASDAAMPQGTSTAGRFARARAGVAWTDAASTTEVWATTSRDEADHDPEAAGQARWTVGADGIGPRTWSGETVQMPTGRLHAVDSHGLLVGRAVCTAPVVLLDPLDWRWPDDAGEDWPLCDVCLALTG